MNHCQRARRQDQAAVWSAGVSRDGALNLGRIADVERVDLYPERRRNGLDDGKLAGCKTLGGISKHRHSRHVWRNLFEQFQPFPGQAVFDVEETSGISTGSR